MPVIKSQSTDATITKEDVEAFKDDAGLSDPTISQTFRAAFAIENSLGSFLTMTLSNDLKPPRVEGYDPYGANSDDIKGYEFHGSEFAQSESPEETQIIKNRIDEEMMNREIIANSGFAGFIAQMAAGITDPIYLPFASGGVAAWAKGGKTASGAMLRGVAVGAASEALAETAKHATQITRTLDESLINIGAAGVLTGLVSGGLRKMELRKTGAVATPGVKKVTPELTEEVRRNLVDESPKLISNDSQDIVSFKGEEPVLKPGVDLDDLYDVESAGGIERWKVSPNMRVHMGKSQKAKEMLFKMVETPIVTKSQKLGRTAVPEGGAIETRIKSHDVKLFEQQVFMRDQYQTYRKRLGESNRNVVKSGLGTTVKPLSYKAFKEEVGKAFSRADKHDIPEVQAVAKLTREKVYDPLKEDAVSVKLLPEDVKVETSESYRNRSYLHTKIKARRNEWDDIVSRWLRSQQAVEKYDLEGFTKKVSEVVGEDVSVGQFVKQDLESIAGKLEAKGEGTKANIELRTQTIKKAGNEIKELKKKEVSTGSRLRAVRAEEKTLQSELQTVLNRYIKFRPDVRTPLIEKAVQEIETKVTKLDGQIATLEAVENELRNEAKQQLSVVFKSFKQEADPKKLAAGRAFQRIENRLSKIRKRLSGYKDDRYRLIDDLKNTLDKTKHIEKGNIERARELSTTIGRLQKKLEPKRKLAMDLESKFDEISQAIQKERSRISESRGYLDESAWMGKQIRKLSKTLDKTYLSSLTDAEIKEVSRSITDNIIGGPSGKLPYNLKLAERGPLKERVFDIPDELIEDFLEKDIEILSQQYVKTMAPDVEVQRAFGNLTLENQIKEIEREFDDLIENAKTEKERTRLAREKESTVADISALRDMLRGTHNMPKDSDSFFVRAGRVLRDVNFLRMLGGMTVSAIPDTGRLVSVNGLKYVGKSLKALALSPKTFNMSRQEAKRFAVGLDMFLNSRAMGLADIADSYARNTKFERALQAASDTFSKITLMAPWNAAMKQFAGVTTADRILSESVNWVKGTIKKSNMIRLANSGISEDMAKRIATEFSKHGDDGVLKLSNAHLWDDKGAYETFKNAVLKDVDRTILTPGVGEKPLWTSSEGGKLIFQFKTFAAVAHHKALVSGLQYRDAAELTGFLISVAASVAVYGLKNYIADMEVSDDPKKIITEAMDRSGAFGYLWDINNISSKITRGTLSFENLIGLDEPMSRYASRNAVGALLGPSFGTATDALTLSGSAFSGEFTKKDLHLVRKMLPFQNLFYIRKQLNALEAEIGKGLKP